MSSSSRDNFTLFIPLSVSPHHYFYFAYNSLLGQDLQSLWDLKWPQDRLQVTACRLKVAICCLKVAGWILFVTYDMLQGTGWRLQIADCRLTVSGWMLNVAAWWLKAEGWKLQVSGCKFEVSDSRLKIVGWRLQGKAEGLKSKFACWRSKDGSGRLKVEDYISNIAVWM